MSEKLKTEDDSLDLVFEESRAQLNSQFEQIHQINGRAQMLVTFSGVYLAALIAVGRYLFIPATILSTILGSVAVAIYIVESFFAYRGYKVRDFERDPNLEKLNKSYAERTSRYTKQQLILNWSKNHKKNIAVIKRKLKNLNRALFLLFFETVYLAIILMVLSSFKGGD
ncbi:MAG: hypothetical protein HZB44_01580 [Actinobacteria bacterium]|nr:hypothetical protein [Actinomycetota bacterium]